MNKDIDLISELFTQAIKNHQENNLQIATQLYKKIIQINPTHIKSNNNLGVLYQTLGDHQKAEGYFEKAIEIDPNHVNAHYNLGIVYEKLNENQKAIIFYEKAIEIDPNYVNAYNNLGNIFQKLKKSQKAKECYEKAIEINPNYIPAYNNLGAIFNVSGEYQKAKDCYEKAIKVNPNYADARYNLGTIFDNLGEYRKAKECFEKVIEIDPNYTGAYWNLHGTASDIDETLLILKKLYKINNKHTEAKIIIAALESYKGNFDMFNDILKSSNSDHPYTRSIKWIFSLPKLPKIFFNRCDFFDAVIKLTDNSRPFYEFGVWNGVSFQYLIDTFKKGFGFDTFNGIPEDWHNNPKGT